MVIVSSPLSPCRRRSRRAAAARLSGCRYTQHALKSHTYNHAITPNCFHHRVTCPPQCHKGEETKRRGKWWEKGLSGPPCCDCSFGEPLSRWEWLAALPRRLQEPENAFFTSYTRLSTSSLSASHTAMLTLTGT